MTEWQEGRRPHDPNDPRGGGGPAGAPDSWDTSNPRFGPLRDGEPNVIYPEGHPLNRASRSHESEGAQPQPAPDQPEGPEAISMTPDAQFTTAEEREQNL